MGVKVFPYIFLRYSHVKRYILAAFGFLDFKPEGDLPTACIEKYLIIMQGWLAV